MEANTAIYQTALYVILARKYIFDWKSRIV
jgi:hypothetical protein